MGSTSFFDTYQVPGTTAAQAYQALVSDAVSQYGHDGYNGTISTTSGFVMHSVTPMTVQQAEEVAEKAADENRYNKWDACGAVPLIDASSVKERTVTKKLRVNTKQIEAAGGYRAAMEAAVKAAVVLRDGEQFLGYQEKHGETVRKTKMVMASTEGKSVIKYFILSSPHGRIDWEKGYLSMAEARKALQTLAEQPVSWAYDQEPSYEIVGVTRRENGDPLVKASRKVVLVDFTVDITTIKVDPNAKQGGWAFFGFAAC
jgi:hypothetical protein